MAGELLDRFLEAAPVPLGLPAAEVERRLGPARRALEGDARPTGFEYPERGVWIAIEGGEVSAISFLTGGEDEGGARFEGELPGGLRVTDPPARVRELYGEPDRAEEVPLPRPPRTRLTLWFYALAAAPATVTFAYRSTDPRRLERIVLARRTDRS